MNCCRDYGIELQNVCMNVHRMDDNRFILDGSVLVLCGLVCDFVWSPDSSFYLVFLLHVFSRRHRMHNIRTHPSRGALPPPKFCSAALRLERGGGMPGTPALALLRVCVSLTNATLACVF